MRILVVGGHTRNIGKTALAAELIAAFPEARWTAVKITLYGHGVCSDHLHGCHCAPRNGAVAIEEEFERDAGTDSARFLAAGAARSFWLRARQGRLADALPLLRRTLDGAEHVIVESNSLLGLLRPQFYVAVLDPARGDFKASARRMLDRADALVLRAPLADSPWEGVAPGLLDRAPRFLQPPGEPLPAGLREMVRERFFGPGAIK